MNSIYRNAYQGVVEITVTSQSSSGTFGGGSQTQKAQGSGFVYDASGDVVTNEHVVDGASSVRVKFWNGSTYVPAPGDATIGKDVQAGVRHVVDRRQLLLEQVPRTGYHGEPVRAAQPLLGGAVQVGDEVVAAADDEQRRRLYLG